MGTNAPYAYGHSSPRWRVDSKFPQCNETKRNNLNLSGWNRFVKGDAAPQNAPCSPYASLAIERRRAALQRVRRSAACTEPFLIEGLVRLQLQPRRPHERDLVHRLRLAQKFVPGERKGFVDVVGRDPLRVRLQILEEAFGQRLKQELWLSDLSECQKTPIWRAIEPGS